MKKRKKKLGRPNPILLFLAYIILTPYYKIKYHLSIDRRALRGIKGPALILAPHISRCDHLIIAMALYPIRPTFVLSEHFMMNKKLRPILKRMHVITKKMFCSDAGTIMGILRAKNEKNVIVLFPEGRLTWYGHSLKITDGTSQLVKKLGCDVYTVTGNGAYLTFPKWSKLPRRGKINVTASKLLSGADISAMKDDEIERAISNAILHDEEKAMEGTKYSCSDMTEGLDGILYRCPECRREFTMTSGGGEIKCTCGMTARLDEYYKFHGSRFSTVNEWYDWQQKELDTAVPLKSRARVGTPDENGFMVPDAGEGEIYLDRHRFYFSGTVRGEKTEFMIPVEKLKAFPITVAKEFDVRYGGRLYYMYPLPDTRAAVKWVSYLDKINAERSSVKTNRADK